MMGLLVLNLDNKGQRLGVSLQYFWYLFLLFRQ